MNVGHLLAVLIELAYNSVKKDKHLLGGLPRRVSYFSLSCLRLSIFN